MVSEFNLIFAGSYVYEKKDKETKKPLGVKATAINLLEYNKEKNYYNMVNFFVDDCTIDFSKLQLLKPCKVTLDIQMSSGYKKLVDITNI